MDESGTDPCDAQLADVLRTTLPLLIAHSLLFPNNNEKQLLNKLQGLVTNIKWSPADASNLFGALLKRFESTTNDRSLLLSRMLEMLHCIEINFITPSWKHPGGKTLIDLVQDETMTDDNLKKCLSDDKEKQLDEIIEEIRQQKLNQVDEKLLNDVKDIVSSVVEDLKLHKDGSQRSGLKRDLLRLCRAVKKTHFTPRLTQMVSWCIMALSETGRLIQVGTGEGKSCIVAMFAAFRAMSGEKVDIMSSSSVLAERDMKEWQTFYKALNISVDCNTNKQDKHKCYKCQVVYGTVEEFAGDWLRHNFGRQDTFGQRKFQCAIVDEVDSLMLDKGHHVVYLSSNMPALQHLNPLLAFIWATANQYKKIGIGTTVGQKHPFPQVILKSIQQGKDVDEFTILQMAEDAGILAKGSVKDLRKNKNLLTEKTARVKANQLAEFFKAVERRFPSCQFAVHCMSHSGAVEELNSRSQEEVAERQRVPVLLSDGGFCQYMYSDDNSVVTAIEAEIENVLHFTPCELSQDKCSCYIPGFLSELVKSQVRLWIKNAFEAQSMTNDHQYIIEEHGIVPVDYSCTGVVENSMQWSDGLHQFLEMKHQSKLADMTAITNYMSNVGLLQMYGNQIFGISGTLGQQAETETLQKIYHGIKTCQIPTFKRRRLFEIEGVFVKNELEWIEKICHAVMNNAQRAVLIICEIISHAKILHEVLGDKVPNKRLYISNNMDNTAIFAKKLGAGEVVIATNLAGRGTDLQVSDQVKKAGGLFVIQTFLPKNARVEAQAFGRTARQGSPGSAQLIVCCKHLPEPLRLLVLTKKLLSYLENMTSVAPLRKDLLMMQFRSYQKSHSDEQIEKMSSTLSDILTINTSSEIRMVKEIRDESVAEGLASYLEHDIPKIKKKAELFNLYLDELDEVYKRNNNKPAESYLSALNEFWGMWLLMCFNHNESIEDLKNKLTQDLKKAMETLNQKESPSSNLHHYTVLGNELREQGHLTESIQMYTKAIQKDHCWAAVAYYNRAFAFLTQQDGHQHPDCIDQALVDLQNALKSVELYCDQIEVTCKYSKQPTGGSCRKSSTRFDSHIRTKYTVLVYFKANITEAIKKVDRARDLGGFVKVTESLVFFLVPLVHFLPFALLSVGSLNLIHSRDPLRIQQLISQPDFDILHELRCLKSLGLTHVYTLDTQFTLGGFFSKIHRSIYRALD